MIEVNVKSTPSIEIGFERKVVDSYKAVDSELSTTSENPLMNKVVAVELKRQSDMIDTFIEEQGEQNEAFKEEVNEEIAKKADKDGKYPRLTAGFANNLVGRGEATESEFTFRASGGKSIEDGTARIAEMRGNGVVWNNLATTENARKYSSNDEAIVDVVNQSLIRVTARRFRGLGFYTPIVKGHKYLLLATLSSDSSFTILHSCITGMTYVDTMYRIFQLNGSHRFEGWFTPDGNYDGYMFANWTIEDATIFDVKDFHMHDLTLMFGAGNEPTTLEEYYARKPIGVDEYAYNAGTLIPFNAEGIKSVGDNLFNEDIMSSWNGIRKTEDGWVGSSYEFYQHKLWENKMHYSGQIALLGKLTASTEIRATIRVFYTDGTFKDFFKTATTTTVEGSGVTDEGKVVDYIKVVYASTGDMTLHYLMIALVHSGYKVENGLTYQPYEDFTRQIDSRIREAFPNGMKPWDKVYNKNGKGYIVKGSGEVAMNTLTGWGVSVVTSYGHTTIYANAPKDALKADINNKGCLLCSNAPSATWSDMYAARAQGIGMSDAYMRIYIDSLTDVASAQAYFQDATLWYELADEYKEVIEYDEPFNLDYQVWDFGTEQIVASEPCAPISADIIYQFNAVDSIRNNQIEIAQLKAMIATMQAQMASMVSQINM